MNVVIAFIAGIVAVRALWFMCRPLFEAPLLQRTNFRNVAIPTAAGLLFVGVALLSAAFQSTLNAFNVLIGSVGAEVLVCFTVVGYGFLGLWDDLLGATDTRGFKGHMRALLRGHITTGAVKLFGGAALAVVLVAERSDGWQFLIDAALIALAANFANLLDLRPGRVLKVALVAYIPLAIVAGTGPLGVAFAPIMGAALGIAPEDLRARLMLGDTGANILGGLLGLGVVYFCGPEVRWIVCGALFALNVLSEFVSFTKIIAAVPPLRVIDELGRETGNPA